MAAWTVGDYDSIFRDHPPTQPEAPDAEALSRLAAELGRSIGAVKAQWDDARSLVLHHTNDASSGLRDYLRRRGWL